MAYSTPKTNWVASDGPTETDLNRIENNIVTLATLRGYATAGGTATAITVTTGNFELIAGRAFTFICNGNNNGAPTTINADGTGAKNLYKPNTTDAPNLISGKAYTVWYNGTSFFVKASAEGDAVAGDVLADKIFSNDDDTGVVGTMTNNGTVSTDISAKATEVTIAQGYHSGSGKVKIATAEQNKIITGNIKAGVTILGVAGKTEVVDTSSGDAVAGDILNGKKAWVDGSEVTGTASLPTIQTANVIYPTAGAGTITFTGITLSTKMTVIVWADNDPYNQSSMTTFLLIKRDAGTISHGYVVNGGYYGRSGLDVITVDFSGTSIEITGPNWDQYSIYRLIAFNQE